MAGEHLNTRTPIYLELGQKRVFAGALDWPGWCRSGRDEAGTLAALAASAPRYAVVAAEAGLGFSPEMASAFEVVERLPGSSTTDFGAPDKIAALDGEPLSAEEAERIAALVAASWCVFDRVVARAPAVLTKGPRGGGRDRDAIVEHVLAAETAYARKIGVRQRQPKADDAAAVAALRDAIVTTLRASHETIPVVERGWPARYAARRIAWHVLDHAWEVEERGGLTPERAW
ncbi:MAG TPA: hypothetical protein VMP10_05245 [Chloroflexota bacterium]|nr:hypothetical protein [Chloroflexota bacterium]